MTKTKNPFLKIVSIDIAGKGFRALKPQNINLSNFDAGLIKVNAISGGGKTTLKELTSLASRGAGALRDKNFAPETEELKKIDFKIGLVQSIDAKQKFYIRVTGKDGTLNYSFLAEDDFGQTVETKAPLGSKITPSEMQKSLSTALTYGVEDFLSEDPLTVRKFIESVPDYYNQLKDLGLVGDKDSENWHKTFNYKIEQALIIRDSVQRRQSELGAYKVNLEKLYNMECPEKVDIDDLNKQIEDQEAKIKQIENDIISENERLYNEYSEKSVSEANRVSELKQNLSIKAAELKDVLEIYNYSILKIKNAERNLSDATDELKEVNKEMFADFHQLSNILHEKLSGFPTIPVKAPISIEETKAADLSLFRKEIKETIEQLIKARNDYTEIEVQPIELPTKLKRDISGLNKTDLNGLEVDLFNAKEKLNSLKEKMQAGLDNNIIVEKFKVYFDYTDADEAVKDLYRLKNLAYQKVNCGVPGLKITTTGQEGKERIVFGYTGEHDKEYFQNPNKELRLLTSYSDGQRHLIAALLQVYLMKLQDNSLNALWFDRLGTDKKLDKLFNDFAAENGLIIFLPATNDKKLSDIEKNEVLIENGEIIFK